MGEHIGQTERERALMTVGRYAPELLRIPTTTLALFNRVSSVDEFQAPKNRPGIVHGRFSLNGEDEQLRFELKAEQSKSNEQRSWLLNLSHTQFPHAAYYSWRGFVENGIAQPSHWLSIYYPGGRTRALYFDLLHHKFSFGTRIHMNLPYQDFPSVDMNGDIETLLAAEQRYGDSSITRMEVGHDFIAYQLMGIPSIISRDTVVLPTDVAPVNLRFRD